MGLNNECHTKLKPALSSSKESVVRKGLARIVFDRLRLTALMLSIKKGHPCEQPFNI